MPFLSSSSKVTSESMPMKISGCEGRVIVEQSLMTSRIVTRLVGVIRAVREGNPTITASEVLSQRKG